LPGTTIRASSDLRLCAYGYDRAVRPLAVAAAVLVALLAPSAALADRYDDTVITITYKGTLKTVRNNQITQPLVTQLDWDLTWTGKVYDLEHSAQSFTVRKLSGATAATVPGNAAQSCSASIAQRAGRKIPVAGGREPGGTLLTAHGFPPITAEELQSDDVSPGRICNTFPSIYGSSPALEPSVALRLGSGIAVVKRSFDASYNGPAGSGNEVDTLKSTLELRVGRATGAGTPTGRSTPDAVRRVARKAILWDLPMAGYSCFVAGTGVVVFGTSGPAIGLLIGPTLTSVAAPVCARMIQAIKRFALTYDDPPVAGFDRIARVKRSPPPKLRLPACTDAICDRVTTTARAYVAAVQHVTDVASTLATTVGRESAARKAGHRAAASRQARRALKLVPTLRKAARAQATAGAAFAAALRAAGATGAMTADQRATGNEAVLTGLVKAGVKRGEIAAIAGAALTPAPLDPLAALGSKL
jgi:hypothetical protein